MTDDELKVLEALAEKATPGPWHDVHETSAGKPSHFVGYDPPEYHSTWVRVVSTVASSPADVAFIAAARTAVPSLIAEVRRLRKNASRMHGIIDDAIKIEERLADGLRRPFNVSRLRQAIALTKP